VAKIELTDGTRYAVEGRLVTLDAQSTVMPSGVLYIEGDTIVDVRESSDPAPAGFSKQTIIKSGGTIYPGLIELHNHLSYNIIPTWMVPQQFLDRDQWRRHKDYRKKMTGPLNVLGGIDGYLQAIVRFVECRLLFSGVTSSQGITLASHQDIKKSYRGVVRNVEQTVDMRVIAAANSELEEKAKAGRFREDLYHRLRMFRIEMPPLRGRGEDLFRLNVGGAVATIGKSIIFKGELTGSEDLEIDGSVEGDVKLPDHVLKIGANGKVKASLVAKCVQVVGRVIGDVTATERVIEHTHFLAPVLVQNPSAETAPHSWQQSPARTDLLPPFMRMVS